MKYNQIPNKPCNNSIRIEESFELPVKIQYRISSFANSHGGKLTLANYKLEDILPNMREALKFLNKIHGKNKRYIQDIRIIERIRT